MVRAWWPCVMAMRNGHAFFFAMKIIYWSCPKHYNVDTIYIFNCSLSNKYEINFLFQMFRIWLRIVLLTVSILPWSYFDPQTQHASKEVWFKTHDKYVTKYPSNWNVTSSVHTFNVGKMTNMRVSWANHDLWLHNETFLQLVRWLTNKLCFSIFLMGQSASTERLRCTPPIGISVWWGRARNAQELETHRFVCNADKSVGWWKL